MKAQNRIRVSNTGINKNTQQNQQQFKANNNINEEKRIHKTILNKQKAKRVFGSHRYDYIKSCTHDLNGVHQCPLCLLANQATRSFFEQEKLNSITARNNSILKRAKLRITLLQLWSRNQTIQFNRFLSTPIVDIVMSNTLATLITQLSDNLITDNTSNNNEINFEEIVKILSRRNRMEEVGYFAAIFLQSRIRKYLARRKVRKELLVRFEYVPATKRKGEFWVDNYWSRKWTHVPRLLRYENPATPRTISRRLAADGRRNQQRMEVFILSELKRMGISNSGKDDSLKASTLNIQKKLGNSDKVSTREVLGSFSLLSSNNNEDDFVAEEMKTVKFLRQAVVLRDIIHVAMFNITRNAMKRQSELADYEAALMQQQAARPRKRGSIGSGGTQPVGKRGSMGNLSGEVTAASSHLIESASKEYSASGSSTDKEPIITELSPVWVSFAAPASPARQLGIALALELVPSPTGPLDKNRQGSNILPQTPSSAAVPSRQAADNLRRMATGGGVKDTPSSVGRVANSSSSRLHRYLQLLEQRAWECLQCSTPEQVVSLLLRDEIRPILESVINICGDDKGIWNGSTSFVKGLAETSLDDNQSTHSLALSQSMQESSNKSIGSSSSNEDKTQIDDSADDHVSISSSIATLEQGESIEPKTVAQDSHDEVSLYSTESNLDNNEAASEVGSGTSGADHEYSKEVLPFALRLHPYNPINQPNGLFRLFFYWDELIVVSAMSPWTFYPELSKNKDVILNSVRAYAALPTTKAFVKQYLMEANEQVRSEHGSRELGAPGVELSNRNKGIANARNKFVASIKQQSKKNNPAKKKEQISEENRYHNNEQVSLYVPPEGLILGDDDWVPPYYKEFDPYTDINDHQVQYISEKYSFLKKMSSFAYRLRVAKENKQKLERTERKRLQKLQKEQEKAMRLNAFGPGAALEDTGNSTALSINNRTSSSRDGTSPAVIDNNNSKVIDVTKVEFERWLSAKDAYVPSAVDRSSKKPSSADVGIALQHHDDKKLSSEDKVVEAFLNSAKVARDFDQCQVLLKGSSVHRLLTEATNRNLVAEHNQKQALHRSVGQSESDKPSDRSTADGRFNASMEISLLGASTSMDFDAADSAIVTSSLDGNSLGNRGNHTQSVQQRVQDCERMLPEYPAKLLRYSSRVHTAIIDRIHHPEDVEEIAAEMYPLVVIDICVRLPPPGSAAVTSQGNPQSPFAGRTTRGGKLGGADNALEDSGDSGSESGSAASGSKASRTQQRLPQGPVMGDSILPGPGLYEVDLHQVVGAFSCSGDKMAPNLDCCLLDWSHFYEIHQSRRPDEGSVYWAGPLTIQQQRRKNIVGTNHQAVAASVAGNNDGSKSNTNKSQGVNPRGYWSNVNPSTGATVFRSPLPSGKEFQFHILSTTPSKDYLEEILPKKVKKWLGLPV